MRYIRRTRHFECAGLRLRVPPGVFHPGVFFSSPIFVSFLQKVDFQGKSVVDIGTGSGLLALFAAQKGAIATALDIHPLAVEAARSNAESNRLPLRVVQSDLFDALAPAAFDAVLINPPYYPRAPRTDAERAFFAGENWGYFEKLFSQLHAYIHRGSQVWMVLSEDCNLLKIKELAQSQGFSMEIVFERKKWGERFWVLECQRSEHW
jgi:release factor glutamine methyltransferase